MSFAVNISRCSAAGSAPVSGTGGREFESRHFDHFRAMCTKKSVLFVRLGLFFVCFAPIPFSPLF